jgi:hypothetical protein
MRQLTLLRCLPLPVCFALLCTTGCSEKKVSLSGKLVLPASVKLDATDTVNIVFIPEGENGVSASGAWNAADRTFTVKDAVPGKYKITVRGTPYMGEKGADKRMTVFDSINKANDAANTKLRYEITAEPQQSLTVDVDKGTVTKG